MKHLLFLLVLIFLGLVNLINGNKKDNKPAPPVLAMVALKNNSFPDAKTVVAYLNKNWPDNYRISDIQEKDNIVVFNIGDEMASFFLVPMPIPWRDLEGPCAISRLWPDATKIMKKHKSHIIITLAGGRERDKVSRIKLLTILVASIAANTETAGIYWGAGTVVLPPGLFIDASLKMTPKSLPLFLWIDFMIQENQDGSFKVFTTGMEQFDCMDIEVDKVDIDPNKLYDKIYNIAYYMITSNTVLKDGETIGEDENEKIRIKHAPSMWDKSKTVIKLEF